MPTLEGTFRAESWSQGVQQEDGSVTLSGNSRAYLFEGKEISSFDMRRLTLKFTVECLDIKDPPEGGSQPEDMNIFAEIDANGDKVIDEDELNAWFKSKRQMDVPEDLWENEDKDGDRQITWEEFSGPKGSSPDDL